MQAGLHDRGCCTGGLVGVGLVRAAAVLVAAAAACFADAALMLLLLLVVAFGLMCCAVR